MGRWKGPLVGLSLGLFVALLVWPSGGWLVRSQLRLLIPSLSARAAWSPVTFDQPTPAWDRAKEALSAQATLNPGSFRAQLAKVILTSPPPGGPDGNKDLVRLRALVERFPNEPGLRASLLRASSHWKVRVDRPEAATVTGERQNATPGPINQPADLREFASDAAAGERLDPDNAFFPFMQAVGQFAARKDSEAFASLERASTKPKWNDYVGETLQAELDLYRRTFGNVSGLPRRAIVAAILLPHLIQATTAGRTATALAAEMEAKGLTKEGLKVRISLLRCGALMRVQSNQMIGNLVGRSLAFVATSRPGGAPLVVRPNSISPDDWNAQRLAEFDRYLRKIGRPEALPEFERQLHQAAALHRLTERILRTDFEEPVWRAAVGWVAGLSLLSVAGWLTILAGFCALAQRVMDSNPAAQEYAFAFGLVVAVALCSAMSLQLIGSVGAVTSVAWGFMAEGRQGRPRLVAALTAGTPVGVPLIGLFAIVLAARRRRVSVVPFACQLMVKWAISAAALLLLAYGILVPFTVSEEARLNYTTDQVAKHEGRFLAAGVGADWPE